MRKIEKVLRLRARGFSARRISIAAGIGRATVIGYPRRTLTADLS